MQITAREIEYCKLHIDYETGAEQIENKKNEVLTLFKNLPVKGYRKGVKVPLDAIRLYYAREIDNTLKQALAEEAYHNSLHDQNVKPFGNPQFSNINLARNKFNCEIEFNIRPRFELSEYKDLEIPKQQIDFDKDIETEKALQNLRNRFGDSTPFEDSDVVQMGDSVIIDYEAFDSDAKINELCGTGQLMTIGQSILSGFDNNLLGLKNGESRTFYLKVPDTLLPSYANKELKFVVSLLMGSKNNPLPLNDELAKKAGKETFADLRKDIVGLVEAKLQELERKAYMDQITNKLIASHNIKVPEWLILSEAKYLAASSQLEWDIIKDVDKEKYLEVANKNVQLSLILDAIKENEPDAQLSDREVLTTIEQSLNKVKSKEEVDQFMEELNKSGRLSMLAAQMRDQFVFDFLIKHIKIIE